MDNELYPQSFIERLLGLLPGRIKYSLHRCYEPVCGREGIACFLPDNETQGTKYEKPDEYYCVFHAQTGGYCWCCGQFWAGVESFDFGPGICENCREEFDEEFMHYDDEAVDDYDVGFNGQWFEDPAESGAWDDE